MNEPRTEIRAIVRRKWVSVQVAQITHFTAGDKYVTAHFPGGEILLSGKESLNKLEAEFGDAFLRTHRSVLVARRMLGSLRRAPGSHTADLKIIGVDGIYPVSYSRYPTVRKALAERRTA
ncbi:LytTR family DNA-binding domain-containing protein [Azotobacter vinelandii]|uniref:LytTR family DNA-binding domain-containing protein n=1 Tax=Azotobacter vinelandii TaxID=354 RepID=UPI002666A951|nr:LytTR family DNA-binding domain-containing protein [Azotobacter vinelandii]WKN20860.1 LytTR family transcriptional regulator DNA-binding domain-containing protein [Azotobacter vinelandii]